MKKLEGVRVRFAPSPTGALHIGGIRTALYNYLFARQHGGRFLLRIEDTDQNRYVPGAEEYIIEALKWAGITPDEGVGFGGDEGPYRQSDRMQIYKKYAIELVKKGHAYYAFDTPEALESRRAATENFTYNYATRMGQENSLSLLKDQVRERLEQKVPYVIRLKITPGRAININDLIRGEVILQSEELDDKVLLKADGMPTYHLANVVDDHLMRITHVIRGEEWLPSAGHHILLYEAFGWENTMPRFAHLPLIMKPVGTGKLSKRDGAKFGMPVFPLSWKGETEESSFEGFRETGFLPEAMLNFLALLGWHPGNDQEIFSLDELVEAFSFEHISKSGARFDYEKAKWFNQRYMLQKPNTAIAAELAPLAEAKGYTVTPEYLEKVTAVMKERVVFIKDILTEGYYFFEPIKNYDEDAMKKRWTEDKKPLLGAVIAHLEQQNDRLATEIEEKMKHFMQESGIKGGDILPLFRLALAGSMKGPGVFEMMEILGKSTSLERLSNFCKL